MMRKLWAFFDARLFRNGRHARPGEAVMPRVVGEHLQRLPVSEGQSLRSVRVLTQPPRKEGRIRLALTLVVRFPRSWDLDRAIVEFLDPDLYGHTHGKRSRAKNLRSSN